ncbi:hypothetical protein JTE90_028926 [Oedothorax gibbosus]|uniref:Major facilitator superfamily associated domain-containing protein n=1 Tax=Oedothorax gibbosus TaxID=931172 RepID=A0AAV6VHD9_9ARAC|nr:hypothetical protein JTE90_028926 [Oedothorax gibbosus]
MQHYRLFYISEDYSSNALKTNIRKMKLFSCKNVNGKLLPMKFVMFGWFGASACALPYMTVHMKELGLTVEETAVVYTLLPITQFLSAPIAGFIGDRLGKYRDVLLLSIVMTIILATALLYVPPVSVNDLHETVSATFMCDGSHSLDAQCSNLRKIENMTTNATRICQFSCSDFEVDKYWNITINSISSNLCTYDSSLSNLNNETIPLCSIIPSNIRSNCSIICTEKSSEYVHVVTPEEARSRRRITFCLYSALRIVYNIFSAIGFTLVNSSAIALTETSDESGEYGRQRLWAMVAMAIFSPLAGILVDVMSTDTVINYAPAFHTHNILALLTCIAVWYLDFEMEDAPASYMETFKNFWKIVRSPSIFFLLIVVFWLGTMWGFLESFLFWFMIELNSPTYMMGLTVTVGSLVGLPFLYYARLIVAKVGHAHLLSLAVFMYMIRCVGCSFLIDPWWIMPFEILEIFTYHLMWVAAATYAANLSPPGLLATIQGFIEGVHYGVGQGSGSLIGGALMSTWGSRSAFRVMGGISGGVALIYSILHLTWLKKEKVDQRSRRASVKSYGSQKQGRKNSTLSYGGADGNGTVMSNIVHSAT